MFTEKELFILSNGLLGLIEDIGNAKRLVKDDASHAAMDNAVNLYRELNSKLMSMVEKEKGNVSPRWIQIWYSWGDQESPVEVPADIDPWEYMKQLAVNEAETAFSEFPDYEIGMMFFPDNNKIILHYNYDDEFCYYKITNTEDFEPDEDDY